jgi:hypothetical protein
VAATGTGSKPAADCARTMAMRRDEGMTAAG